MWGMIALFMFSNILMLAVINYICVTFTKYLEGDVAIEIVSTFFRILEGVNIQYYSIKIFSSNVFLSNSKQ